MVRNKVRAIRESLFMTQDQLAQRSGVSVRCVRYLEGGRTCKNDTKRKILKGLGRNFRDDVGEVFPVERLYSSMEVAQMCHDAWARGIREGQLGPEEGA